MVQDTVAPGDVELTREHIDSILDEANRLRETEQWDRILSLSADAKRLSETIGYCRGIAKSLGLFAFVHYMRSDLHLAIDESMQALAINDGDAAVEGRLRGILSLIHWSLGNYDDMEREGARAMVLYAQSGNTIDEGFGWVSRAGIAHSLGDYETALEHSRRAIQKFQIAGPPIGLGRAFAQLGAAHLELGDLDRALEFHHRALDIGREVDNRMLLSRALNELGIVYMRMRDYGPAEDHFKQALEIRTREGYRGAAVTSLLDLGRLYLRMERYDEALEMAERAEQISFEIGARPKLAEAHQLLSNIHEKTGNLAEALRRFKAYQQLREHIAGEQSQLRIRGMQLMAQVQTLRAEQAESVNAEKMAAVGSLVGALAHEMNSPLGVIQSSADTVLRALSRLDGNGMSKVLQGNAETMAAAVRRISSTLQRLKSFAGLDLAEFREAELLEGIEQSLAVLAPEFGDRITIVRDFQPIPRVKCYAAELNQVFLNLLRNAVQAIHGKGEIRVGSRYAASQIRLSFADTGRGIAPDVIPRLFNPGFNQSGTRVQAALSLFTCLNIVQKHRGSIEVESKLGEGSTFTVVLPVE